MRLLNTSTLVVDEFIGTAIPEYGILSHTWGDEEVTLQDLQSGKATSKKGYGKLKKCCEQAASDGFSYCWVDTCCIDKTSSSELSEAINSMYAWYRNSHVCYAYLADCEGETAAYVEGYRGFLESRWWTRGWTLQELIAPKSVEFYDADWTIIGTKLSLQEDITAITGIDKDILQGSDPLRCNVAVRMSWAASRQTTRVEDRAYCLMGLFGVNMPLLYGEGCRAFLRLQEEILRISEDHTLFAWFRRNSSSNSEKSSRYSLLADSPSDFLDRPENWPTTYFDPWTLKRGSRLSRYGERSPLSFRELSKDCSSLENLSSSGVYDPPTLTGRGLRITLPLWSHNEEDNSLACLSVLRLNERSNAYVCIMLHPDFSKSKQQYRCDSAGFILLGEDAVARTAFVYRSVYIHQQPTLQTSTSKANSDFSPERGPCLILLKPNLRFNAGLRCLFTSWVNVDHVVSTLLRRRRYGTGTASQTTKPSDDKRGSLDMQEASTVVSRARYNFRLHQTVSTFTDYSENDLPPIALNTALDWCWFSSIAANHIYERPVIGTLALTHEHYAGSAFVVHLHVSEEQSFCDVILVDPRDLEGWKREMYMGQARNVKYHRDRVTIRLLESAEDPHLAHLQVEFTFSIRRIATAELKKMQFRHPPMRVPRFVLSITERYVTDTGRPVESNTMSLPVITLTAPD